MSAYGRFKAKDNFKRLAALKVVAVAPPSECIWLLGVFVQVFWQSASLAVLKIQRFAILGRLGPTLVLGGGVGGGVGKLPYKKDGVLVVPFREL